MAKKGKRVDWEINNRRISDAIFKYYKDNKKEPTNAEIAKLSGLSENTVSKHMKEIDFGKIFLSQRRRMSTLSGPLFMSIYNSALKGNAKAQELMMQLVFEWAKPMQLQHTGKDGESLTEMFKRLERQADDVIDRANREKPTGSVGKDSAGDTPQS